MNICIGLLGTFFNVLMSFSTFQNAVQTSWPTNRQMAIVPSWQQLPPQHAAMQQPLLSDAADWARPLLLESSNLIPQRSMFPVEVSEVYDPMMEQQHTANAMLQQQQHHLAPPQVSQNWSSSKRVNKGSSNNQHPHHHQSSHHGHYITNNHLAVPISHRQDKKETTQLSPVKKRVKEGTPPSGKIFVNFKFFQLVFTHIFVQFSRHVHVFSIKRVFSACCHLESPLAATTACPATGGQHQARTPQQQSATELCTDQTADNHHSRHPVACSFCHHHFRQ